MKINKGNLSGSYDERHDVLYIYYKGREHSYGEENPEGIVTFRSINSDELSGYIIYDFKTRNDLMFDTFAFEFRDAIHELTEEIQNGSIKCG